MQMAPAMPAVSPCTQSARLPAATAPRTPISRRMPSQLDRETSLIRSNGVSRTFDWLVEWHLPAVHWGRPVLGEAQPHTVALITYATCRTSRGLLSQWHGGQAIRTVRCFRRRADDETSTALPTRRQLRTQHHNPDLYLMSGQCHHPHPDRRRPPSLARRLNPF